MPEKVQIYFRILVGCVLVFVSPLVPPSGIVFFVLIFTPLAVSSVIKFLMRESREDTRRRHVAQQSILRSNRAEALIALGLTFFLPLLLGGLLYFAVGFSYETSATAFVGASYTGAGLAQLRLEKALRHLAGKAFD